MITRATIRVGSLVVAALTATLCLAHASEPKPMAAIPADPLTSIYTADWQTATIASGVESWAPTDPYGAQTASSGVSINGALAVDPIGGTLYGASCCSASAKIFAFNAVNLAADPAHDIALSYGGALASAIDVGRRILYAFDDVSLQLTSISLDSANYGASLESRTLVGLAAQTTAQSVGNDLVLDTATHTLFVTGGDGGAIIAVDVSAVTTVGGAFGATNGTGQTARSTGGSGGGLAIDIVGRHVYALSATGVHVFSADAPYTSGTDIVVTIGSDDVGAFFDPRMRLLWLSAGAGSLAIVDVDHGTSTTNPSDTSTLPGRSIAGNPDACLMMSDGGLTGTCSEDGGVADASAVAEGGASDASIEDATVPDASPIADAALPTTDGASADGGGNSSSSGGGCGCNVVGAESGGASVFLASAAIALLGSRRRRRSL